MIKALLVMAFSIFVSGSIAMAAEMVPKDEAHFLEMLSEHHKDAIKMADLAQSRAQNKEVKDLARKISKDQKAETEKLQSWKKSWYPNVDVSAQMPKMDMAKLETSSGKEFDMEFLMMMTKHHEDGVSMLNVSMPKLQHKEAKSLAEKGIKKQTAEIAQMQRLHQSIH